MTNVVVDRPNHLRFFEVTRSSVLSEGAARVLTVGALVGVDPAGVPGSGDVCVFACPQGDLAFLLAGEGVALERVGVVAWRGW